MLVYEKILNFILVAAAMHKGVLEKIYAIFSRWPTPFDYVKVGLWKIISKLALRFSHIIHGYGKYNEVMREREKEKSIFLSTNIWNLN